MKLKTQLSLGKKWILSKVEPFKREALKQQELFGQVRWHRELVRPRKNQKIILVFARAFSVNYYETNKKLPKNNTDIETRLWSNRFTFCFCIL